ncbi:hypothetical protein GBAR_LOCUS4071 [Geodia barretti]|uniref:Uncharacterized protein n=1 Tax=Geodia barretti TaxID=519541 RepID=A0AA35R6A3_GEOBA|nr:hypothetical protein GBAR_LOCUS4071 [Geodia barretti]
MVARVGVGQDSALFHRILYDSIPEHPRSSNGSVRGWTREGFVCPEDQWRGGQGESMGHRRLERYTAMTAKLLPELPRSGFWSTPWRKKTRLFALETG